MKKLRKVFTAIVSFALCATVLTAGASAASSANATYIGDAKAKEIALADAKVNSSDAKYMSCVFEYDDGTPVYDVEFHYSATEYNYEINAKNGKIISREKDYYGTNTPQTGVYIGKADAKEIAFKEAGISEKDAKSVRVSFEYDDGRAEYTVEFHANSNDYEYEIDALTGNVLSADIDKDFSFSDIFFIRWISSFFSFIGGIFN